MSREKLKVLEMVAEGKIKPEEGIRLIEALGQADRAAGGTRRGSGGMGFDMPDVKIPKIDLGQLGEIALEIKNAVMDEANKASGRFKRSRAGKMFKLRDYPLSVERAEGIDKCSLGIEVRAGKLKLKAGDTDGKLIKGKVKRVPDEPIVLTEVRSGRSEVQLKHTMGRALLRASDQLEYRLALDNAAADARLDMTGLHVENVDISNNAGTIWLKLGERAKRVEMNIDNNAGHVRIGVPGSYSVRIKPSGNLSSNNLEKYGLEVIDGVAVSSDWDDNSQGVDILLSQNVASFQLDWQRRDGVRFEDDELASQDIDSDDDEIDEEDNE